MTTTPPPTTGEANNSLRSSRRQSPYSPHCQSPHRPSSLVHGGDRSRFRAGCFRGGRLHQGHHRPRPAHDLDGAAGRGAAADRGCGPADPAVADHQCLADAGRRSLAVCPAPAVAAQSWRLRRDLGRGGFPVRPGRPLRRPGAGGGADTLRPVGPRRLEACRAAGGRGLARPAGRGSDRRDHGGDRRLRDPGRPLHAGDRLAEGRACAGAGPFLHGLHTGACRYAGQRARLHLGSRLAFAGGPCRRDSGHAARPGRAGPAVAAGLPDLALGAYLAARGLV